MPKLLKAFSVTTAGYVEDDEVMLYPVSVLCQSSVSPMSVLPIWWKNVYFGACLEINIAVKIDYFLF